MPCDEKNHFFRFLVYTFGSLMCLSKKKNAEKVKLTTRCCLCGPACSVVLWFNELIRFVAPFHVRRIKEMWFSLAPTATTPVRRPAARWGATYVLYVQNVEEPLPDQGLLFVLMKQSSSRSLGFNSSNKPLLQRTQNCLEEPIYHENQTTSAKVSPSSRSL